MKALYAEHIWQEENHGLGKRAVACVQSLLAAGTPRSVYGVLLAAGHQQTPSRIEISEEDCQVGVLLSEVQTAQGQDCACIA